MKRKIFCKMKKKLSQNLKNMKTIVINNSKIQFLHYFSIFFETASLPNMLFS